MPEMNRSRRFRSLFWTLFFFLGVAADSIDFVGGFGEPYMASEVEELPPRDAAFYADCTLKQVENICARNITMAREDGSIVRGKFGGNHDQFPFSTCPPSLSSKILSFET